MFLLIIVVIYLFKHVGLFGPHDYKVIQAAESKLTLPEAVVYSFATNPYPFNLL